ncbi:MAG: MASE1 domain-containing protein, partial [Elusimicrobia bacterium]|nr:MASE1 domain-containing protein [Elusimicrobiota bacterium]
MKHRALATAAAAGLAVVYALAAKLGLSLAVIHPSVSAVWPPSAIALGALLVLGPAVWPGVLAGAFAINLHTALAQDEFGLAACLLSAAALAAGNTLEAVAGAWAVNRFAGGRRAIENSEDFIKLALFAGLLATMIGASVGVLSLRAAGMLPAAAAAGAWLTWWLGDASGILVGTPIILAWTAATPQRFKGGRAEGAALALVFAGAVWFIFLGHRYPTAYFVLPVVIWTAFRFGMRGAAIAVFGLSCAAVYGTVNGRGPFALGRGTTDLLILQGFLATVAVSTYVLAALIWERERSERDMLHSRDRLE